MAIINNIKTKNKRKGKKRIGRGGKKGTYSGRGMKGQKARAGRKIKPQEKQTLMKLPKLRGYRFNSIKTKPSVITFKIIEKYFKENEEVSLKTLINKKIISKNTKEAKILLKGKLTKKIIVKGLLISKKAKEEILKLGGEVKK